MRFCVTSHLGRSRLIAIPKCVIHHQWQSGLFAVSVVSLSKRSVSTHAEGCSTTLLSSHTASGSVVCLNSSIALRVDSVSVNRPCGTTHNESRACSEVPTFRPVPSAVPPSERSVLCSGLYRQKSPQGESRAIVGRIPARRPRARRVVSTLSLHRIEADKFCASRLVGKFANIGTDLPTSALTLLFRTQIRHSLGQIAGGIRRQTFGSCCYHQQNS